MYGIIIANDLTTPLADFALSSRHSGEVNSLVECERGWKKKSVEGKFALPSRSSPSVIQQRVFQLRHCLTTHFLAAVERCISVLSLS